RRREKHMERHNLVLAALAAGGENASYWPVQVQKLLFLIDREASALVGGPHFDFKPYDYGPFDRAVYVELDALSAQGFVSTSTTSDDNHCGVSLQRRCSGRRRQHVDAKLRKHRGRSPHGSKTSHFDRPADLRDCG